MSECLYITTGIFTHVRYRAFDNPEVIRAIAYSSDRTTEDIAKDIALAETKAKKRKHADVDPGDGAVDRILESNQKRYLSEEKYRDRRYQLELDRLAFDRTRHDEDRKRAEEISARDERRLELEQCLAQDNARQERWKLALQLASHASAIVQQRGLHMMEELEAQDAALGSV